MMVLSVPITKTSKDVEIEIEPNIPTLYDKEFYVILYDNIKFFLYENLYRPISNCIYMYPKFFGCFIFLLILVGAICTVIFTSKTNQYPCIKYTNTDLASSISQSCLTYLWSVSCSLSKRTFDPSNTWWTNSPDGIATVKCDSLRTGSMCGAGSYQVIVSSIQYCNPQYRG
jgi:hypothetical protein